MKGAPLQYAPRSLTFCHGSVDLADSKCNSLQELSQCTFLKSLSFRILTCLRGEDLRRFTFLTKLDLQLQNCSVSPETGTFIAKNFTNLTDLSMREIEETTDRFIQEVVQCPRLIQLSITQANLPNRVFESLARAQSLCRVVIICLSLLFVPVCFLS